MGFFISEEEAELLAPRRVAIRKVTKTLDPTARGCDACARKQEWPRLTTPCMPLDGSKRTDILVLGERLDKTSDMAGKHFMGPSGKFLRKAIPHKDMDRVAFDNAVRCFTISNRNPTPAEVHACSVYLDEEIHKHEFKAILGLGLVPLTKFFPEANLANITGVRFPVEVGGEPIWYFPTFHPAFLLNFGGEYASQYPVFQADIKRFFKEVDKWPKAYIHKPRADDVNCVYHEDVARQLVNQLEGVIGVDLETSALRPYEKGARLLTASFSDGKTTFAFPINHPEASNEWGMLLLLEVCAKRTWIAHNAAFELCWMLFHGRRLFGKWEPARFEDSQALGRLYHQRESLTSLATLSRIHLGVNIKTLSPVSASNIMAYPLSEVLPYNGLDAWGSIKLWELLGEKVAGNNYERLLASVRSTTEMELAGLPIDQDEARAQETMWVAKATAAQEAARTLYEVRAFERERQKEFNIGAPEDVGIALVEYGKLVLPKTSEVGKKRDAPKEGAKSSWSTDDSVLQQYADTNPLVPLVLEYREATKHNSTYVQAVLEAPKLYPDGMLHPTYTVMLTRTGRLSSASPNIQNWPKRKHRELRKMIRARPGHVLVACDEGQLEARVYGMLTKDNMLCSSIIGNEDIHTYWLDRVLDYSPDYIDRLAEKTGEREEKKIRKYGRNIIKADFVFATFFGSTADSCAERTGIPPALTKQLVDEFWGRYPEAQRWVNNQRKLYRETGAVHTLTSRGRYGVLPGNEILNTPIQGTAADLVMDAQNELDLYAREVDDIYLKPILNVHDDLSFECPDNDDKLEMYIKRIAEAMTRVRYKWQIVPLNVEIQIGYNWCDMEEVAVITGDYVR